MMRALTLSALLATALSLPAQTIETGQPAISQPISDTEDRTVLVISVPITTASQAATGTNAPTPTPTATPMPQSGSSDAAQGKNIGTIAAVINVSYLESIVVPYARGKTEIGVVSKSDVIVGTAGIAKNIPYFLSSQEEHINQALEGDSGNFTSTDASGSGRLGVFAPIQSEVTNWAVIVTSPAPGTYSRSLVTQSLVALLLASIVILTLAVIFGEFSARQLRTLAARADSMKRGDFSVNNEPVGGGEIRELSIALADMGNQLATQMHGLEESQVERSHQAEQMRNLLRRTLRLQEDERRRIAGDIHDAVSPLITGALYQARALQMRNGASPPAEREETLANVNSLLEQASNEIHSVIFDLRPPDLDDIGVVAAIEAFIQTFSRTGLACRLEVVNDLPPQTPEVASCRSRCTMSSATPARMRPWCGWSRPTASCALPSWTTGSASIRRCPTARPRWGCSRCANAQRRSAPASRSSASPEAEAPSSSSVPRPATCSRTS